MWRLVYVLLVCAVVLTWETVRVSFGDGAPHATATATPVTAPHTVTLTPPLWPTPGVAPTPAAGAQTVTISIPRLGIHAPVVDRGLDAQGLLSIAPGYGVTHYQDSAPLGAVGNYVAYGHDDIQGEIFHYLSRLQPGDAVDFAQGAQHFRYVVTGSRVVAPTAVEVLRPTVAPTLTLISCTPYMVDTERIVVSAALDRVQ